MKSPTSISQGFDKSNKATFTVIRSRKIVWKHGPYCWYFCLDLKDLRWPYRDDFKTGKNGSFCMELFSENHFEAVLATFCCYDCGANGPKAVQKISRDQKDYHKYCSCVTVCWITKIYQSTAMKKVGYLLTRTPPV